MKVGFLIEESLRDHPLLSEEAIAVSIRTGLQVSQKATRITFFRNAKTVETYPHYAAENCLGYVIIFELSPENKRPIRYVYEAVITVPCLSLEDGTYLPLSNYYTSGFRKYTFTLGTFDNHAPLSIEGTYFCQQNDRTHVCAHAALRMAVNNSWVRPSSLLTPEEINRALKIDHTTKTVGKLEGESVSKGVTLNEISTVIESLGAKAQTAVFSDNPSVDYQEFVYPIVESGCPVILGINRPNMAHVVTILGHTLNSDRWMPQAQAANGYGGYPIAKYISSTAWVDHFIISDDNFGMFVTLHTEGIRNIIVPKYNSNLHASVAVGIVPPDVLSVGSTAEQLAALFAGRFLEGLPATVGNKWLRQLQLDAKVGALVCRTLLVTRSDYVAYWRSICDQHNAQVEGTTLDELEKQLPVQFWVTELSVPNLYAGNKRKLGDVSAVAAIAGKQIKRSVLELGGSDAFVVMPSAPLAATVEQAVKARMQNNGQSCIAAKRFIVHAVIYDEFEKLFVAAFRRLRVGDPLLPETDIGPLAQAQAVETLEKQVQDGIKSGARVLVGGKRRPGLGFFFEPTILVDIPIEGPFSHEELFGPVAMLFRAQNFDEAIKIANSMPFGLGASLWTQDEAEQQRGIRELQAGQVFINGIVTSQPALPFGGIKQSGYGRELGAFGIREFVNAKSVRVDSQKNKEGTAAPRSLRAS